MRGRPAEALAVGVLAAALIAVIAASVIGAPTERIFGRESVGRHHDPFTVIAQLEQPVTSPVHTQPVTDIPAALLARVIGGVAAYNWIIILTFPFAAASAYLLARHFAITPVAATFAALAFAFSPFHLAHAAYHPHIAQVQWIPLYVLTLVRCLDQPSAAAVAWLLAAAGGAVLSNFYGGLILATLSPVVLIAYWLLSRERTGVRRSIGITALALGGAAAAALLYVRLAIDPAAATVSVSRDDLFLYSAKWWSYLVPPVAHPLIGDSVRRLWTTAGVGEGLLEQQLTIGAGVMVLAAIGLAWRKDMVKPSRRTALMLAGIATVAVLCSLSPEGRTGGLTVARPSSALYEIAPMFRAYARFGVVVQLMAVLLAAIGLDQLLRAGTSRARLVAVTLILLTVAEYVVSPAAQSRDVFATPAHRWVRDQGEAVRAADCTEAVLIAVIDDCAEPHLAEKLAAGGYTHVLTSLGNPLVSAPASLPGLRQVVHFANAQVLAVDAPLPVIYTARFDGFYPRESDHHWSWRWMAREAGWQVTNTATTPVGATVEIEMSAFSRRQAIEVRWDQQLVATLGVDPGRRRYPIRLPVITRGTHALSFHALQSPLAPSTSSQSTDPRPLSVAVGRWQWTVDDGPPQ